LRRSSGNSWQTLAGYDDYGLTTNTPAGSDLYMTTDNNSVERYAIATKAWGEEANGLDLPGGYMYGALVADHIYILGDGGLYDYSIADKAVTFTSVDGMPDLSDSETVVDGDGNLWAATPSSGQIQLVKYKLDTAALTLEDLGPSDFFGSEEPRLAWDPTTSKLYLGDYEGTKLWAFDEVNGFTALADFPDASGMNDAFCTDYRGHVFTSNSNGTGGAVWKYTVETDTWSKMNSLPFDLGDSGSCTVSGDGYLYMNGYTDSGGVMARLKIF
jgi:sugar lactone lactonase YvrE